MQNESGYIDDQTYEGPESTGGFMKLEPGVNQFRIVSGTYHFKKHMLKEGGKFSSEIHESVNCQYCLSGNKPKNRYAWIVIDRKDGEVKILEQGWQVYEQMLALAKDKEYGDLKTYDLKITKKGEGLDTNYQVVAVPSTIGKKITKEEQEKVESSNIDLAAKFSSKLGKEELPDKEEEEIDIDEVMKDCGPEDKPSDMPEDFLKKE